MDRLPELNRRRLLLGLAAASTAAATVTVAAAAPAENPELIRLGNALPGLVAEYANARAVRLAIIKEWSHRWPAAPDELLYGWGGYGSTIERGLAGEGIEHPTKYSNERKCRNIWTVEDLQSHVDRAKSRIRRARTDRTRAIAEERLAPYAASLPAAKRYEARCKRIRDASGIVDATERRAAAEGALVAAIDAIMEQEESSMAGAFVKAQAMAASGDLPFFTGGARSMTWGPALAASIIRQAGGMQQ